MHTKKSLCLELTLFDALKTKYLKQTKFINIFSRNISCSKSHLMTNSITVNGLPNLIDDCF